MTEMNGPYIIEEFEYVRDAQKRDQGTLMLTAAGGEQFAAPMTVKQLQATIDRLRRELGAL